jgi:hypothetical protein
MDARASRRLAHRLSLDTDVDGVRNPLAGLCLFEQPYTTLGPDGGYRYHGSQKWPKAV